MILDVADDCNNLIQALLAGDTEVAKQLTQMGEQAASALSAELPGPITLPMRRGSDDGPARAAECGPVLRTLAKMGSQAVPFVAVRTADADPAVRAWATRLLGEMPTPEAANAVARRILDENREVQAAALAAGRLMQAHAAAREQLRDTLVALAENESVDASSRVTAIVALKEVRDGGAVSPLSRLLAAEDPTVADQAHEALLVLTRQDLGRDPAAWQAWWEENRSRHRIEWLIDALVHDDQTYRRAAGDELKALTREYFGFYDDLPRKERARAQSRYRNWWETKGKARFH